MRAGCGLGAGWAVLPAGGETTCCSPSSVGEQGAHMLGDWPRSGLHCPVGPSRHRYRVFGPSLNDHRPVGFTPHEVTPLTPGSQKCGSGVSRLREGASLPLPPLVLPTALGLWLHHSSLKAQIFRSTCSASHCHLLCMCQLSPCLPLSRTHVVAFKSHLDNPG